jgi:glutamine amidotransferase
MLGVVAARPVALRALLRDVPRSLSVLSTQHPDGWGIASAAAGAWTIRKGVGCAARCPEYERFAAEASAHLAIAHVRQKTVGETSLANTHPFRRGRFVLAHNGTVVNVGRLVRRCGAERLAELEGETDSERLLAFVLSRIDEAGDTEEGLGRATAELHATPDVGAVSFLFSDTRRLYVHRHGRTLYVLERTAGDQQRRANAVIIASERLTDEPWREIAQGTLLAIDPGDTPTIRVLLAAPPSTRAA